MKIIIADIFSFFLDLLFPKFCVGCQKEGIWICQECLKKIILIKHSTCPNCNKITRNGNFCLSCRQKSHLTGVMVAAYYSEGPLKEAIHIYKYEGVFDMADELGKILIKPLERQKVYSKTVFMAVPLHHSRLSQRGFNQSELLARYLIKSLSRPLIKGLIRHRSTKKTQVELSGQARRENIRGIFSWKEKKDQLQGKKVILVDDIYTTGATLQECAKTLHRDAGAKEVWGLVLAKA